MYTWRKYLYTVLKNHVRSALGHGCRGVGCEAFESHYKGLGYTEAADVE